MRQSMCAVWSEYSGFIFTQCAALRDFSPMMYLLWRSFTTSPSSPLSTAFWK
jgi:hypothetical protein